MIGRPLPNALTEPSCFCDVDGCSWRQNSRPGREIGGAKIAVGDGAAWCVLKAPFAVSRSSLCNAFG
jgi:hypothetical protein